MSEYRVERPTHLRSGARRRAARVLAGFGATLVLAAAYSPHALANVYEWKIGQETHFTDRPPPPGATLVSVRPSYNTVKKQQTEESNGDSTRAAPTPRGAADPTVASAPQTVRNQVQQDLANKRAEQCQQAGERYKKFIESRQLYREGANGERVYLSEQELEAARVNAKREVDAFCAEAQR